MTTRVKAHTEEIESAARRLDRTHKSLTDERHHRLRRKVHHVGFHHGIRASHRFIEASRRHRHKLSTRVSEAQRVLRACAENYRNNEKSLHDTFGAISNGIVPGAQKFLGVPYLWGGTTPKGFDCSGLAQYVYNEAGIKLPRTSEEMWTVGQQVSEAQAQPGDLVFFEGNPPGHVGIYIGNGQMIDAPHTGTSVRQEPIWTNKLTGFRHIPGVGDQGPAVSAAPAAAAAPAVGAGASMQGFATALLQGLKAPVTPNNINNIMDWMQSESGGLGHRNNPLNSSYLTGGPGDGTGAYPSLTAAAHADALQIMPQSAGGVDTGGKYDAIYNALMNDAPWHVFKDGIVASPWASSHYNGGATFSHQF